MPDDSRLVRADELEDQARTETRARAQELGLEAAELRKQVLGEKPYPVLVCSWCFRLTGWLGSKDRCDVCIAAEQRNASFADPRGSFVHFDGGGSVQPNERTAAAWKRVLSSLGWRRPLEETSASLWAERVDPGVTGPPMPEQGFVIFDAERSESPAPEGVDILVRFSVSAYEFAGHQWQRTVQSGGPVPLTPHTFPASLEMSLLAEAWSDYCAEVTDFNAALWSAEDERREDGRQAAKALREAREEQGGTSDLLD